MLKVNTLCSCRFSFMVKSPHGLLALAAIGIMNGDSEFVSNVMPHLEEFKDEESVLPDIGLLKACFHIMNVLKMHTTN